MTKEQYVAMLLQHTCVVEFEKKSGGMRKMVCTLKPEYLEKFSSPIGSRVTTISEQVRCMDMEIGEWRSFLVENVKFFTIIA